MTKTSPTALVCPSYVIRVSSAKMPNSCWGRYVHVGVLECDPDVERVPAIDVRCKGVRRIVGYWGRCNSGGSRSASEEALRRARALVECLEAEAWGHYVEAVDRAVAESLALRDDEI